VETFQVGAAKVLDAYATGDLAPKTDNAAPHGRGFVAEQLNAPVGNIY
jgi:hypothetical protein